MAKAAVPPRPPLTRPRANRTGLVEYFRSVWDELKKVVWPARDELLRMTGIVVATVILFAALIGGADYILSLGVKQIYTTNTTSTNSTPAPTAVPTAVPTAASSPNATPVP